MLYVCIYNEKLKEIEFSEELPINNDEEKDWAIRWGINRLDLECRSRGDDSGWTPYASKEKQFSFNNE